MAEYTNLDAAAVRKLVETLNPWFQGEQQKSMLAFADQLVEVQGQDVLDNIITIFDRLNEIQSMAGASTVGITDMGGYFTGNNVEDALQELGAQGGKYYLFSPTGDQATWVINHNLGRKVQVQAFTPGGVEMMGQVTHINDNQAQIDFDGPYGGYAVVE